MGTSVINEYKALIEKLNNLKNELAFLPVGYISKKTIKGKTQYYLQHREGTKITGSYIRAEEAETIAAKIERRKEISEQIVKIDERIGQLEKAAEIIGKDLFCTLMIYKLSSGMDGLSKTEKERCSSFGAAMNAVEGVPVSTDTNREITAWKNGSQTFISVFESTLRRYGFPTEV